MATSFGALCSEFYINQRLALNMDLPNSRETVLDLFDRVRKEFPHMERFRRYEGEVALESVPESGSYDWLSLHRTSIRSGSVNPDSLNSAYQLHRLLYDIAPYFLSISPLDVRYVELTYGFDLEARGNHDVIVYDALIADTPLGALMASPNWEPLDMQPFFTFAVDEEQMTQVNYEVKTRPSAREVEDDKYDDEPISIYLHLRRMGPVTTIGDLQGIFEDLSSLAERLATDKVIPLLLTPITQAIRSGSC